MVQETSMQKGFCRLNSPVPFLLPADVAVCEGACWGRLGSCMLAVKIHRACTWTEARGWLLLQARQAKLS